MIQALELLLQAYTNILNTPHKTPKERQLMGNLYSQLALFGGQPYRLKCEKAKVAANAAMNTQKAQPDTGADVVLADVATMQVVEKKNPIKLPASQASQQQAEEAAVAEGKKRGPKPKAKE